MSAEVDPTVIAAGLSGAVALGAAAFTFKTSRQANKLAERKVDQDAYESAVRLYKEQLEFLQTQLDRMTAQVDRMSAQIISLSTQLDAKTNVEASLKEKVNALQVMVDIHQETIKQLQATITRLQSQHVVDDPTQKVAGSG